MAASRSRYGGSFEDVVAALAPFAKQKASFLRYDESKQVKDSKHDPADIQEAVGVLEALHKLDPKFLFPRRIFTAAMNSILQTNNGDWQLSDDAGNDYVETMTRRLMNVCHGVNQVQSKKTGVVRYLALGWETESSCSRGNGGRQKARGFLLRVRHRNVEGVSVSFVRYGQARARGRVIRTSGCRAH